MQAVELLQIINQRHQTHFTFGEKYPDGEQGAFVIVDHAQGYWVLKWAGGAHNVQWMEGAKAVTDRLAEVAYPVPNYNIIGKLPEGIYSIQSMLPGAPMYTPSLELLPRLLELNQLQVGRALVGRKDWHEELVRTVLFGGDGYCLHASLLEHSQTTADLLSTFQVIVRDYQYEPHRVDDIVHTDFHYENILIHNGEISGVVDWDSHFAGDCVFDIATLLFYSYDDTQVCERLWAYALERASLKLMSCYLAHMMLRQVDWSLRYHDQGTSERYIKRSQALLQEIASRF